jgi:GNAT superfamily N-acetyltransferase
LYRFFPFNRSVVPINCDSFFYDLPPEKTLKDKYSYGVFENSSLIAAIDVVSDYPEKGEWIIGLLLIHPKARNIGLGKRIHDIVKKVAKNKGAEKLRIGVVKQNINALTYWNKIGYKQIEIIPPKKIGIIESKVVVMNYKLKKIRRKSSAVNRR